MLQRGASRDKLVTAFFKHAEKNCGEQSHWEVSTSWCKWTATSHRPVRVHQRPIGIFYLIDQEQISQSAERSEVKEKRMSVQFQNRHASCSSKVKIKLCQIARYRAFCGPRLHVSTYRRDTKTFAQSMNFYGTTLFLFLSGGGGDCVYKNTRRHQK